MISRYINNSMYSVDNFFKDDRWLFRLKVNNYQIMTLVWNIGLMFVPWLAALFLYRLWRRTGFRKARYKLLASVVFLLWLLFIPNTAYVMSEVRHLLNYCPPNSAFQVCEQNAWMSLFFYIYASLGWIFYVYLLTQMQTLARLVFNKLAGFLFIIALIPAISLGFLLGLLNRWNSWEFFIYPKDFFATIPIYWTDRVYFTNWLFFTIFLYILYWGGQWLFKDRFKL